MQDEKLRLGEEKGGKRMHIQDEQTLHDTSQSIRREAVEESKASTEKRGYLIELNKVAEVEE